MPVLNRLDVRDPARIAVDFDPRWAVRSMFGGAVAAVAVRAARQALGIALPMADAMFAFLAPTPAGGATIQVEPIRTGRRFASAEITVRCGELVTVRGSVAFAAGAPDIPSAPAVRPAGQAAATFGDAVEWQPEPLPEADSFSAWVRSTAADIAPDEWACIATDILAPAVVGSARAAVGGPFTVATATLTVSCLAPAAPTGWLRQSIRGSVQERTASGLVDLTEPSGRLIARASQHAALVPAASEDPRLITAFANSVIHSQLFGMN